MDEKIALCHELWDSKSIEKANNQLGVYDSLPQILQLGADPVEVICMHACMYPFRVLLGWMGLWSSILSC